MKLTTADTMNTIETIPAHPLLIPQVEIVFNLPDEWLEFINEKGINVAHIIDRFVTGFPGHMCPRINPSDPESFGHWISKYGDAASKAIDAEKRTKAAMLVRRDLWDLFQIQASNVGKPPIYVLMVLCAKAIDFEKRDGAELRMLMERIRTDEAKERERKPVANGRVVPGEWKANPKKRGAPVTAACSPGNVIEGIW